MGYTNTNKISDGNRRTIKRILKHNIPASIVEEYNNSLDRKFRDFAKKSNPNAKTECEEWIKDLETYYKSNSNFDDSEMGKGKGKSKKVVTEQNDNVRRAVDLAKEGIEGFYVPDYKNVQKLRKQRIMGSKPVLLEDASRDDPIFAVDGAVKKHNQQYLENLKHPFWNTRIEYNPRLENPNYAAYYAKKYGGKAYRGDFNDDGVDDIVVAGKSGKIQYINGQKQSPSNRGINLMYYDSDIYKNHKHLTEKGTFDLFAKSGRKQWIESLDDVTKADANKVLKAAGMTGFKVKGPKATDAVKNNASIIYDKVIEALKQKYPNIKNMKSKLNSAQFAARINNAILLALGDALDRNIPNENLNFYINKLAKVMNKEEQKEKFLAISNEILEKLGDVVEDVPQFAELIYTTTAKNPSFNNYKQIAAALMKAKEIAKDDTYSGAIRTKKGALVKVPKGRKGVKPGTKLSPEEKAAREAEKAAIKAHNAAIEAQIKEMRAQKK